MSASIWQLLTLCLAASAQAPKLDELPPPRPLACPSAAQFRCEQWNPAWCFLPECARPAQAIPELPLIQRVLTQREQSDVAKTASPRLPSLEECAGPNARVLKAYFDGAATFPIPYFDRFGDLVPQEGAVIYEGMRFVALDNGRYEVSFVVGTPSIPVTLRLQLYVVNSSGQPELVLTLPPIAIVPDRSFRGNYPGDLWSVRTSGYSRALAAHFDGLGKLLIVRQGTARFGSWPEGANQFERVTP